MLKIKEISGYKEFSAMKEAWDDLIARGNVDNVYLSHDWMDPYISNCCNGNRLIILTVFDSGCLIGIAPLMIRKYHFAGVLVKSVCFVGTGESDRMDFILDGPKEKCILSIMDYLMGIKGDWDFLDFQEIPESSGTAEIIEKWIKQQGLKFISGPWEKSFFIKLGYDSDFILKKISKKFSKNLRKIDRKSGIKLGFKHYMHSEAEGGLFSELQRIARHSWKGNRQRSIFLKDNISGFHRDMLLRFAKSGCLDVSILTMNNIPVAYIYNFLYNGRLYNYSMEFDSGYSRISPGAMLMLWTIEESVSKGIKEIDFGRGEERWKERLTHDFRRQAKVRVFKNSLYGNGLYLLFLAVKFIKARKGIYRALRRIKQRFL